MTDPTHQYEKTVIRYEVWCDECDWVDEYANPQDARIARSGHANYHRGAAALEAER